MKIPQLLVKNQPRNTLKMYLEGISVKTVFTQVCTGNTRHTEVTYTQEHNLRGQKV